jgi:hypothetical protein
MVLDPEKIQIEFFFIPWVTLQGIRVYVSGLALTRNLVIS